MPASAACINAVLLYVRGYSLWLVFILNQAFLLNHRSSSVFAPSPRAWRIVSN